MKRQKLLNHLRQDGCQVVGGGARHTRVATQPMGDEALSRAIVTLALA